MEKYETELDGYVPLKYVQDNNIITSDKYKINLDKVRIINSKNRILKFNQHHNGYLHVAINGRIVQLHHLIWQHRNGTVADGLDINHIDNDKTNNKIENLQLLAHKENILTGENGGHTNKRVVNKRVVNKRIVKVIDTNTGEITICPSFYGAGLFSGVNCGVIKMCCDNFANCKFGLSKTNNHKYSFEYTDEKPTIINKRFGRFYKSDEAEEENKKYMMKNMELYHKSDKYINHRKLYYQKPEVKERIKKYLQKPEVIQRMKQNNKLYFQKPEAKQHMKQKNNCECGGKYTNSGRLQHMATKMHKNYIGGQNMVDTKIDVGISN